MAFVFLLGCIFCTCIVLGALLTSGVFGNQPSRQFHVLLGLIGATVVIMSHCAGSFYVIETSIQIKRAVKQKGLGPSLNERHKPHKDKVFPSSFVAMVTMIAAAVLGGAVDSGAFPLWVHQGVIAVAIIATAVAWPVEMWAIRGTRKLIYELNEQIVNQPAGTQPLPEGPEQITEEIWWLAGRWMLFMGISLWAIYGYLRIVMQAGVSLWPYVASSVPLILFGCLLQHRYAYQGES